MDFKQYLTNRIRDLSRDVQEACRVLGAVEEKTINMLIDRSCKALEVGYKSTPKDAKFLVMGFPWNFMYDEQLYKVVSTFAYVVDCLNKKQGEQINVVKYRFYNIEDLATSNFDIFKEACIWYFEDFVGTEGSWDFSDSLIWTFIAILYIFSSPVIVVYEGSLQDLFLNDIGIRDVCIDSIEEKFNFEEIEEIIKKATYIPSSLKFRVDFKELKRFTEEVPLTSLFAYLIREGYVHGECTEVL